MSAATPFAALTLRSLVNERGDFLVTTIPIADPNAPASLPIAFPQMVDGGGYVTQFIRISSAGASGAALSHNDEFGTSNDFGNQIASAKQDNHRRCRAGKE